MHGAVFGFDRWQHILNALNLNASAGNVGALLKKAEKYGAGGESERHKALKEFVARSPNLLQLKCPPGKTEQPLPSGDRLDVEFETSRLRVAAEVKTADSPTSDVTRGLFQCVKYNAVMKSVEILAGTRRKVRSILVLEGKLPSELVGIRNTLAVELVENVKLPASSWRSSRKRPTV